MTDTTTASEAFAGRLLDALTGAAELFTVELGRRLGLYRALRPVPLTAPELVKADSIERWYTREWL